jgi:hypothetical protein
LKGLIYAEYVAMILRSFLAISGKKRTKEAPPRGKGASKLGDGD